MYYCYLYITGSESKVWECKVTNVNTEKMIVIFVLYKKGSRVLYLLSSQR